MREKDIHPATFPISLAKKVIDLFTPQGELVLDPFVRSGTTLLGAVHLNIRAVGFDFQRRYVELSASRSRATPIFSICPTRSLYEEDARSGHGHGIQFGLKNGAFPSLY